MRVLRLPIGRHIINAPPSIFHWPNPNYALFSIHSVDANLQNPSACSGVVPGPAGFIPGPDILSLGLRFYPWAWGFIPEPEILFLGLTEQKLTGLSCMCRSLSIGERTQDHLPDPRSPGVNGHGRLHINSLAILFYIPDILFYTPAISFYTPATNTHYNFYLFSSFLDMEFTLNSDVEPFTEGITITDQTTQQIEPQIHTHNQYILPASDPYVMENRSSSNGENSMSS